MIAKIRQVILFVGVKWENLGVKEIIKGSTHLF